MLQDPPGTALGTPLWELLPPTATLPHVPHLHPTLGPTLQKLSFSLVGSVPGRLPSTTPARAGQGSLGFLAGRSPYTRSRPRPASCKILFPLPALAILPSAHETPGPGSPASAPCCHACDPKAIDKTSVSRSLRRIGWGPELQSQKKGFLGGSPELHRRVATRGLSSGLKMETAGQALSLWPPGGSHCPFMRP